MDNSLSVSRLASYIFWRDQASLHNISYPIPYYEWTSRYGDVCPICQGDRIRKNLYCICSTLHWLSQQEDDNQDWQSPYQTRKFRELAPLHAQPDAADKALLELKKYIRESWMKKLDMWMFIEGGVGVGKTHILQALRTKLPKGLSIYMTAGDFRSKLFTAQHIDGEVDRLTRALIETPILLFDDWGMEYQKLNDWTGATLENVIDRRSVNPRYFITVVTSNNYTDGIRKGTDMSHKRTVSRLCNPEYSRVFTLNQADFRDPKVQKESENA